MSGGEVSYVSPVIGGVRYIFSDYVHCACDGFAGVCNALLLRHISFSFLDYRSSGHLQHDDVCKPLQPFVLGDGCPCLSLRPVWSVEIVDQNHGLGLLNVRPELICKFSLLLYTCDDLSLFVLEISKVYKSFVKKTKLFVVEGAGGFLSISGNEWNCVALVDEFYRCFNLAVTTAYLLSNFLDYVHVYTPFVKCDVQSKKYFIVNVKFNRSTFVKYIKNG